MRKLFALLFVAGTLSFASCGEKKEEASNETVTDSSATMVEESTTMMDSSSTMSGMDSTASAMDTMTTK